MKQNQEQWTALKEAVDGEWIARQAQTLVEIPSVTLQEAEVCSTTLPSCANSASTSTSAA